MRNEVAEQVGDGESLDDDQRGTAIKAVEKEIVSDVAIFRRTYNNRDMDPNRKKRYESLKTQNLVTDADVKKVGVDWLIHQSKGLIEAGAPVLHYYTMGNAEPTLQIAKAIF